jgi:DNA mismatch repair protein MutL
MVWISFMAEIIMEIEFGPDKKHRSVVNPLYNVGMTIQILPDEVASQIAAGEVVERPASVVKELVENALDAGAGQITIRVAGAGQRLVEVQDNGSGIPPDELPLSVTRHATSKLRSADDLFRVMTLGFRGEALASIGSVSHLTITSRQADATAGARIHVVGGKVEGLQPVGAPVGTTVRVEDLFFNVPARRKFLKKEITERRQIDELVMRYALAYPAIGFQLTQEERLSLQTSGSGDRKEALAAIYGVEYARKMLAVFAVEDELKITGFISPTTLTRSNRKEIHFAINGRPVQDFTLTTAAIQAYHTLLMVGRFPVVMIYIEMPAEAVDVNVHPTKAEVRFRDRDRIFSAVQRSIRKALLAYTPVPEVRSQQAWQAFDWQPDERPAPAWGGLDVPNDEPQPASPATQPLPGRQMPILRLVGQVASAYLIAEGPDGLYLIDQHAAHERVLYEKFIAQERDEIPSQSLLEPVHVELAPGGARLLDEQLGTLSELGFRVEAFGRNTYLVRALPSILSGMDPAAALRVLVEDFEEDETPLLSQRRERLIARVCKRAAVKAGQTLSGAEQQALLQDLEHCDSPRTCPHGRPTMIHLSVDLLERQFGRKGAR